MIRQILRTWTPRARRAARGAAQRAGRGLQLVMARLQLVASRLRRFAARLRGIAVRLSRIRVRENVRKARTAIVRSAARVASAVARAARRAGGPLRRHRRRIAWAAAAICVPLLALNLWVFASTRDYRYEDLAAVPARYAAIVPGALVYRDGRPSDILADRLATALDLYRAGAVRKILVSGDHGRAAYDEVNGMRRWLEARGVPSGDIFMDHAGFDTYNTMQRAAKVFRVRGAVIVTQRFHLPRAVYLAREAGIDAVGLTADRHVYRKWWLNEAREAVARAKSFAECHLGVGPRFLGPAIPIDGDGRATWDLAQAPTTEEAERP